MSIIKTLFVFLLLSLSSHAALALPSVTDVETKIAKGEYSEAKTMLEEVLEKQPDSIVATRYMLEVINIEYAGSLVPSVEYKLYENRLQSLQKAKAERERMVAEAAAAKKRAEVTKILVNMLLIFSVCGLFVFGALTLPRKYKAYRKQKELKEEQIQGLENWKRRVTSDLIDLNSTITSIPDSRKVALKKSQLELLEDLRADNLDALECLRNNDFNQSSIDRHLINAHEFLNRSGLV